LIYRIYRVFIYRGCHRSGKSGKPGKVKEIEIGHGNWEKLRENVKKKSGISKFAHNFFKLLLFQIIVIIFSILYLTFQNMRTLNNDFNKIIQIYSIFLFAFLFFVVTAFFFSSKLIYFLSTLKILLCY